jgi:hypothetical protein
MEAVGPELLNELVRITARTSAVIFVAALAAGVVDLLAPPSSSFSRRGWGWKLVGVVIISHTIHFGFVAALAIETHGQNVINRGGWFPTSVVGVLFYGATIGALVLRPVSPAERTIRNLGWDTAFSTLVGLAFLETYLGRFGKSPLFTVMAALLAGAMLAFVAAVGVHIFRRSVMDDKMALG